MLVPRERNPRTFESIEEICNYLLGRKEVPDRVRPRGPGKAVFLMFDEETEELAQGLGLDVAFPPASLRRRLDSKIVTTELGNAAGVPSVPNVLGRARTYDELLELAAPAGLGDDLVVQTPYGDSGQTTHFVASRADWDEVVGELVGEELKAMKRIDPREAAIEGVRHPSRHARRAADDGTDALPRADAVRWRLVRQRHPFAGSDRSSPAPGAPVDAGDGGTTALRGLPRVLRARLPRRLGDR